MERCKIHCHGAAHAVVLSAYLLLITAFGPAAYGAESSVPQQNQYFGIEVVDEQTGRGVPLVELQTTTGARYYTDSTGLVAFYEPVLT